MRCFRHLLGHLESHLYSKVHVILRLSQCTALTYIKYRYKRKFIYLQAIRKGFRTTIYPVKHTIISKTRHLPVTYTNSRLSTSIDLYIYGAQWLIPTCTENLTSKIHWKCKRASLVVKTTFSTKDDHCLFK